jgi:hypothetical protein
MTNRDDKHDEAQNATNMGDDRCEACNCHCELPLFPCQLPIPLAPSWVQVDLLAFWESFVLGKLVKTSKIGVVTSRTMTVTDPATNWFEITPVP